MNSIFSTLSICFFWLNLTAQVPHLEGKVYLDFSRGYIAGEMTLSNLPELGSNYRIQLNRGINIKSIKVDSIPLFYQYWNVPTDLYAAEYALLHNEKDTVISPSLIKIHYIGAFPVYQHEYNAFDDAGIIAHNGVTFRAKPQSAWYPLLKNLNTGEVISDYTYNITVECPDCKEVYMNGSAPQKGGVRKFKSSSPRGLLLFAGDFSSTEREEVTFINTTLNKEEAVLFGQLLGQIKGYFENKLNINYTDKPVLLQHTSIEKFSPGRSWGSVVYPTFTVAGQNFKTYLSLPNKDFSSWGHYAFFSHEMAHFYFGNLFRSKGTMQHILGESIPEYLAMKAVEHKYGADTLSKMINDRIKNVKDSHKNKALLPLTKISETEQISSTYRYQLGPLMFMYIEREVGEKKLFSIIEHIIRDQFIAKADYPYLKSKMLQANVSNAVLKKLEDRLFNNDLFLEELEGKLTKGKR